jgi:membrane protein
MISQAVAFNMFLAFFPMLLVVLGILSSYVNTRAALLDVVGRLHALLPPGSRQVVVDFLLPRAAHPWRWALLGWGGTLLAGTQVMKLLMEGIQVIHADQDKHSFLGRQFRAFLLLLLTLAPFLLVVLLTVFGLPLRKWAIREFGSAGLLSAFWSVLFPAIAMVVAILVLTVIYSVAHPVTRGWREVLPGAAAATVAWWAVNSLFGIYVRKMQYGLVYGGLAAAIGLMAWMQLSAVIVFLGAAWNAEAAARGSGKAAAP